ncbi:hypothetical protein DL96DRAFT_1715757 [Flagelloscypha sp. PMI_526]|nr:hypothetical protein DL96DRAFT_1715757 [Flagelloscypha sp. PMI_526]
MHFTLFHAALVVLFLATFSLAAPTLIFNDIGSGSPGGRLPAKIPPIPKPVPPVTHPVPKVSDAATLQQFLTKIDFPVILKQFESLEKFSVKNTLVQSGSTGAFVQVAVDQLPPTKSTRVGTSQWTFLNWPSSNTASFSVSIAGTVFPVVFREVDTVRDAQES